MGSVFLLVLSIIIRASPTDAALPCTNNNKNDNNNLEMQQLMTAQAQ
jgi:hypothetical protein